MVGFRNKRPLISRTGWRCALIVRLVTGNIEVTRRSALILFFLNFDNCTQYSDCSSNQILIDSCLSDYLAGAQTCEGPELEHLRLTLAKLLNSVTISATLYGSGAYSVAGVSCLRFLNRFRCFSRLNMINPSIIASASRSESIGFPIQTFCIVQNVGGPPV